MEIDDDEMIIPEGGVVKYQRRYQKRSFKSYRAMYMSWRKRMAKFPRSKFKRVDNIV